MDWQSVESFGCPDPSATEREVEWGSTSRIVFIVKLMRSILSSVGKRVRCNDSGIIGKRTVRMCSLRIAPMGIHSIHRWTRLLISLEWLLAIDHTAASSSRLSGRATVFVNEERRNSRRTSHVELSAIEGAGVHRETSGRMSDLKMAVPVIRGIIGKKEDTVREGI